MRSFVLILFGILVLGGVFFFASPFGKKVSQTAQKTATDMVDPVQNSAYKTLTIPYLRSLTYTSKLGEREQYEQSQVYTSYLTSYTSNGLKINGLLTIPTGQMPKIGWPAIVFIHGYIPPSQYSTTERYVDYVDYLARNGFVVFKIDLRGHGESEGKAGGAYFSSDYVIDTLNAYAALANANFVDRKAIGLWGHSMAGNIVMRSLAVRPEISAAVIWAGAGYSYSDLFTYRIQDPSYQQGPNFTNQSSLRSRLLKEFGDPTKGGAFWKEVAPTNYFSDFKGAIEIHHAEDDDVVNIGYSRDLTALLDKTKIPHEFYTYPSGGHNLTEPSFSLAMQRTVEFYKKYLNN